MNFIPSKYLFDVVKRIRNGVESGVIIIIIIFYTFLQESPEGRKMMEFRRSLPAYKERDAILSAISQYQVFESIFPLVIVAWN